MRKTALLASLIFASAPLYANFDWGGSECSGSGSFQQQISQDATVQVGTIPVGKEGVEIQLRSSTDVDIQLEDQASGQKIIHWPDGILSGDSKASATHYGMGIEYSGYNGDGSGAGNEYIKITGATSRALVMKAYGYAAGNADVSYSWTGTVGCTGGPAPSGSGSFNQYINQGSTVTIGDLVSGLRNVYITLESSSDVDVQLVDATNGTQIVQWPNGLLNSETTSSTTYNGVTIKYSGYGGNGTGPGNEYIQITGTLSGALTMKAYGYAAGNATVTYSWGDWQQQWWQQWSGKRNKHLSLGLGKTKPLLLALNSNKSKHLKRHNTATAVSRWERNSPVLWDWRIALIEQLKQEQVVHYFDFAQHKFKSIFLESGQ